MYIAFYSCVAANNINRCSKWCQVLWEFGGGSEGHWGRHASPGGWVRSGGYSWEPHRSCEGLRAKGTLRCQQRSRVSTQIVPQAHKHTNIQHLPNKEYLWPHSQSQGPPSLQSTSTAQSNLVSQAMPTSSLVPRPSHHPVFDRLQCIHTESDGRWETTERGV